MDRALRVVQEKNLTCEDRGALLVDLTKFKMDRAIVRKAGKLTATYPMFWLIELTL